MLAHRFYYICEILLPVIANGVDMNLRCIAIDMRISYFINYA